MTWADFIQQVEDGLFKQRFYSDLDLARFVGVTKRVISGLANGITHSPQYATVKRFESAFQIKLDFSDDYRSNFTYSFANTENIKPTATTLLNKDKTKNQALQAELKEAKGLLQKILGRFFFLEHFYDERYSTFYLKSRVTDPVDFETSDVLTDIENFLNLEELREDARRGEIAINKIEADEHLKKSLKIIMDNEDNNSKNDDGN